MLLTRIITACLLLCLCLTGHAADVYIVSRVYDGDTVTLKNADGELKLRLADIDAPERNQAFGQKARRALTRLCKGPNITANVELIGKDKYNRHLGKLQCNQIDASLYLAENGYAWFNEKYSDNLVIKNAAAAARANRIGLWSADDPTPPWVWRHLHQNAYSSAR